MTVSELLPQLHGLSRLEKLRVIQFLVQDLERDAVNQDDLLSRLGGTWTAQDEADFLDNTQAFREVEAALWS
ncbi:hypothetical protein [Picosynechococcus sp. PCC 8807]|uniref:hypothetical protein n=1 Tax=Picosynechococcus sp. PCC 8807 TaxID=195248 RepID=UPI0008105AA5|nr:hypothetical protein [Picosynechococcus sp. PCC 8807]ANV92060.1 hypothetical protein AWQ24_14885 [Picosynechococcus sp. PCC 8807]